MKSVRRIRLLVAVSLALTIPPAIQAEASCPGNAASVIPRFVQHALIVIPVRINQSGPFDFIVDTGSQVTVIDPSLDRGGTDEKFTANRSSSARKVTFRLSQKPGPAMLRNRFR
jgi:hypothetical protein